MLAVAGGIILALIILANAEEILQFLADALLWGFCIGAALLGCYLFFELIVTLGVPEQLLARICAVLVIGTLLGYMFVFAPARGIYRFLVARHERKVTASLVRSTEPLLPR
jgi:hypothetical protein